MEASHMAWRRIREAQSSGKCKCRFWAASKGKRQRRRRKNCTRKVGRLERRSPWLVGPALMNVLWLYSFWCTLVLFPLSSHSLSSTCCPSLLPLKKSRFHTCREAWFYLSESGLFASCDDFQFHLFPWKWHNFVLLRGCINVCVYMYDTVVCVSIYICYIFCIILSVDIKAIHQRAVLNTTSVNMKRWCFCGMFTYESFEVHTQEWYSWNMC